jgi:hypothetical protein
MEPISYQRVRCPYCGEWIELAIDTLAGDQAYVEDCSVCCRPIEVRLGGIGEDWRLELRRDDD